MNVMVAISSAKIYGAESMLLNLLHALQSLGNRPILAALWNSHHPNPELPTLARQRGFEVELIHCKGRLDLGVIRHLQECIRKYRIDVIHSHGYKADLYAYLASRRPRMPLVATCHNWTDLTAAVSLYGWLDRMVLSRFDGVAAVSHKVAERLDRAWAASDKISVIPNGVPTDRFTSAPAPVTPPIDRPGPVIGMVGRLVSDKGFAYLLNGARDLLTDFPTTRFLVVGEGPQAEELRTLVRQQGLEESVEFVGYCSNTQEIYDRMDILVLPSLVEGMPMVILEAMAAGKPVIATRVGAIPDLIQEGQEGLLVNPGDTPALVAAVHQLLGDAGLRRRMGQRGQELIRRRYSAETMAQRYLEMYSRTIHLQQTKACRFRAPLGGRT